MLNAALSLVMLGAFALIVGAIVMWRRGAPRRRVILTLVLAAVAIANVLVMTVPYDSGETPVQKAQEVAE